MCGSLEEAHARGIVHRDLKPDNVVLVERAGKKDFVKVLDFGIAKRSKEEDKEEQKLTQQGMVLGTPPYMSPEQFTGRPIDSRSDIYSLGVMAYEMLSGKLPFKADTAWEWATQHMTQPPIPIESLAEGARAPESMRAAIRKALAKSPDERFQTVREFIDAFTGRSVAPGMPAPSPAPAGGGRQRTEVGTPLDVGAAFGAAPPVDPMYGAPGAAPQAYTPVGGNVAFPTPAGIPQPPPPREAGGGGNRKTLLVVAGLIGLASVVAIVFAVKGSSGGGNKDVTFDNGGVRLPAPATSLAPADRQRGARGSRKRRVGGRRWRHPAAQRRRQRTPSARAPLEPDAQPEPRTGPVACAAAHDAHAHAARAGSGADPRARQIRGPRVPARPHAQSARPPERGPDLGARLHRQGR